MRKFITPLLLFSALFALSLFLPGYFANQTPTLTPDAVIPEDIGKYSYVISGLEPQPGEANRYTLHFTIENKLPPLMLVLSDVDTVQVHVDGILRYSYDSSVIYQRVHQIPLNEDGQITSATLTIDLDFAAPLHLYKNKIMLTSAENAGHDMLIAYGMNMTTLGIYVLIILYSLFFYLKKPSEHYLLLLLALSATALISALSNSNIAILEFNSLVVPVRTFRIVFCMALCFRLMDVTLPGRWNKLIHAPGIAALTVFLLLLYYTGLTGLYEHIAYGLALPAAYAVVKACAQKRANALIMLSGTAVREGLRQFFRFVELGVILPGVSLFYYYIPQFSSMIFSFSCMYVISSKFASKFNEADRLVLSLAEANSTLDAKVMQRTEDLAKANAQILKEQDKKRSMMTNIFHDLRTPIFNAQGSADMLTVSDEKSASSLVVLQNQLDYLSHLTEELLLIAKLEEGGITFNQFRVRLDSLCAAVAQSAQDTAQQKGIHFSCLLQPDICVTGDSYRLMQVLENLISNALNYTPQGGTVTLALRAEGARAVIDVKDTGQGIHPHEMTHIFERYYHSKQARSIGSSGLGLSIAYEIVKAHQGEIRVHSRLGEGSCFTVVLPLEEIEEHTGDG